MTTAAIYRQDTTDFFFLCNSKFYVPGGRFVEANYKVNAPSTYAAIGQGACVCSNRADLITQARALRHKHLWRFWGLRAPARSVIDSAISVINYCPSEFLLDGYSIDNYGNGTVVMMKRSSKHMITINIGNEALSYAKLCTATHKIVASGKIDINQNAVAELLMNL